MHNCYYNISIKFPQEIENLNYYSKTVRKNFFDEIYNISIDLIYRINKNWSNIEIKFKNSGIIVGENLKAQKEAVNNLINKNDVELSNLLKSNWEMCILLYRIELFILPY